MQRVGHAAGDWPSALPTRCPAYGAQLPAVLAGVAWTQGICRDTRAPSRSLASSFLDSLQMFPYTRCLKSKHFAELCTKSYWAYEGTDLGFLPVILCNQTMKASIIFINISAELKRIVKFLVNGVIGQVWELTARKGEDSGWRGHEEESLSWRGAEGAEVRDTLGSLSGLLQGRRGVGIKQSWAIGALTVPMRCVHLLLAQARGCGEILSINQC